MADFDDLIPKSSSDNPFSNPFADVGGRPRSPDPWSMGASYYEQHHQGFDSSDADAHAAAGWQSSSAAEDESISNYQPKLSTTPPASSSVLPSHDLYDRDEPLGPPEPQQGLLTPPLRELTINDDKPSNVLETLSLPSPPITAGPESVPSASGPLELPPDEPATQSHSSVPSLIPHRSESTDPPSLAVLPHPYLRHPPSLLPAFRSSFQSNSVFVQRPCIGG
ncbi:hypothetical protein DL93DRAFT_875108 [Clavulina sp. PMI_390]|nr:hypothetical protein DL93DRAFT_875108 [Clavulina sp. PMI_390]